MQPRNAHAMADALREHGVPVEERRYPGIGHFRILAGLRFSALAPTLADIIAFVRATPPVDAVVR